MTFVRAKFKDGSVASVSAERAALRNLDVVENSEHDRAYAADYSDVKDADTTDADGQAKEVAPKTATSTKQKGS